MSNCIFIGEAAEHHPYRLLGIDSFAPPNPQGEPWAEEISRRGYLVHFVSEAVARSHRHELARLRRRLAPDAALTVIPDVQVGPSEHIEHLISLTVRAMGINTWTAAKDSRPGETP